MTRSVQVAAILGWVLGVGGALAGVLLFVVDQVPVLPNAFHAGRMSIGSLAILALTWGTAGAVLMLRRPENVVGRWVLIVGIGHGLSVIAAALTSSLVARGGETLELARWTAWLAGVATLLGSGLFYLAMTFPTGRGHTRAWDLVAKTLLAMVGLTIVGVVTRPGPLHLMTSLRSPIGIGPELGPMLESQAAPLLAVVGGLAFGPAVVGSMVSRYRMAGSVERAQLRWFVSAIVLTIGTLMVVGLTSSLGIDLGDASILAFAITGATVPIAILVAILRYRLYDIDRLVSRTIAWTATTGLVLGLFGVLVVVASTILGSVAGGSTLAVAASTVVAAVLFQSVRGRIQAAVDRRFNRAHVDATAMADALAVGLRDEVDLQALEAVVIRTVRATVAPREADVWLRPATIHPATHGS